MNEFNISITAVEVLLVSTLEKSLFMDRINKVILNNIFLVSNLEKNSFIDKIIESC